MISIRKLLIKIMIWVNGSHVGDFSQELLLFKREPRMKKDSPLMNRFFWWPLVSAAEWIGTFVNQCPPLKKKFESPYIQNHPWPAKFRKIKQNLQPRSDPKGTPHSDSKTFNHPRR